jgi:hypothetical protein
MGILGLKQQLLQYLNKKEYGDSLNSLRNSVLGVDLSIWLNLAIFSSENIMHHMCMLLHTKSSNK